MPRRYEEVTATIQSVDKRWGECSPYTVILIASLSPKDGERPATIKLKGKTEGGEIDSLADIEAATLEEPSLYLTYRFYGFWSDYTNARTGETERQFHWQTFIRATPHSRAGVIKYLDNAPGIGKAFAAKLWEKWNSDAVKVLREQPHVAAASVKGLSDEAAEQASEYLKREQALEDCTLEVFELLEGRGFPKTVVKEAVKLWGNQAAARIKRDPYQMQARFRGVGWKRCDALYLELGLPAHKLKRQAYCATYAVMQSNRSSGDTWAYYKTAEAGLLASVGGAKVRVADALSLATRGGIMRAIRTTGVDGPLSWDGNVLWLADEKAAKNEARLAAFVTEALLEV